MAPTDCGQRDKPGSIWDYLLLAAALAASLPFVIANVGVFLHRKRKYFRAQGGAPLILISSTAGLIWIAATFITNMHIPRNHPLLLVCPLWSFWLQLTLGFFLWLACQPLRLLHLHYLCSSACTAQTPSTCSFKWRMLVWALLLWTPGLALTIVATATKASRLGDKWDTCPNCELQSPWNWCTYLILPSIYFTLLVILLIHTKRNKDYLVATEYSRSSEYSLIMALVIYLSYGAAILTKSQGKVAGRCFLTFCVCFVVFINFWVRFGKPVYLCLCKEESEMDSFEEELRSCGADCLDVLSSGTHHSQTRRRYSTARQLGDWVLRAMDAAMNEASECKEKISQLELRKAAVLAKVEQFEVSSQFSLQDRCNDCDGERLMN